MLYFVYTLNGKTESKLLEHYGPETFLSDSAIDYLIDFRIRGNSYQKRAANFRDKVIDIQSAISYAGDLSYNELRIINDWIEKNGRRYGLLRELKNDGII